MCSIYINGEGFQSYSCNYQVEKNTSSWLPLGFNWSMENQGAWNSHNICLSGLIWCGLGSIDKRMPPIRILESHLLCSSICSLEWGSPQDWNGLYPTWYFEEPEGLGLWQGWLALLSSFSLFPSSFVFLWHLCSFVLCSFCAFVLFFFVVVFKLVGSCWESNDIYI